VHFQGHFAVAALVMLFTCANAGQNEKQGCPKGKNGFSSAHNLRTSSRTHRGFIGLFLRAEARGLKTNAVGGTGSPEVG
jgi:hypothetical protein